MTPQQRNPVTSRPRDETENEARSSGAEAGAWYLEQVGRVYIFSYAGAAIKTNAGSATLGWSPQKASRTWHGRASPMEAVLAQTGPAVAEIVLEDQRLVLGTTSQVMLPIAPSPVPLHFGGAPVAIQPQAERLLSRLPWPALARVLSAVRTWARSAPVTAVKVCTVWEPEDNDWEEVVLEMRVDADTPQALRLWDELAYAVDQAKASIPGHQRRDLDRRLGIHLLWQDDPTNAEPPWDL